MQYSLKRLMALNNKINHCGTIDFAKETDLYKTVLFKNLTENLVSLLKKKYLNYKGSIELSFYTHLWNIGTSYESINIRCNELLGKKFVTIFELSYTKDKFTCTHLFQKGFDFDFVEGAISNKYSEFLTNINELEMLFTKEIKSFYNKEKQLYKWYFKSLDFLKIKNVEFNEQVDKYILDNNISLKLTKELSKIITLKDTCFTFKITFFKEYNFKNKSLKNYQDYGLVIHIWNNDGLDIYVSYSIALDFLEIDKINLISYANVMKKNVRFKKFLKKELIPNLKLDFKIF